MAGLAGGADVLRGHSSAVGTPTWRAEHRSRGLAQRARGERFAKDGRPLVERNSYRIERFDILDYSISRPFLAPFRNESSEHTVPHHQHAGIIAVEIPRVGRMMHAMM